MKLDVNYRLAVLDDEDLDVGGDMAWAVPQYSKSRIDWAGGILVESNSPEYWTKPSASIVFGDALQIIANFRSSHSFPLNTFQTGLRPRSRQVDDKSLIAQRIKRLSSIEAKLSRFPSIRLSQMQDIGGCRAVVGNIAKVRQLVTLYKTSDIKHKLDHVDDYIENPKRSGYRSVHLIYRYYSDRNEIYNGLKIEVQLRSPLQHAWATAVETVGTFIQQALKSSQGAENWLRFFSLMGTAIAEREHSNPVPDTPIAGELKLELKDYVRKLDVENHLRGFGYALQSVEKSETDAHYYLLELDTRANTIKVTGYRQNELPKASDDYLNSEKQIKSGTGTDAVLVSVESLSALRRAYPNYFADTHVFMDAMNRAIS